MRYVRAAALIFAAIATTAPASAGETIRIETRPFYGAVITREAGVRVYRPLPPTSTMIINPGGKTPLSLNVERHNYVQYDSANDRAPVPVPDQMIFDQATGVYSPHPVNSHHGHHGKKHAKPYGSVVKVPPGGHKH